MIYWLLASSLKRLSRDTTKNSTVQGQSLPTGNRWKSSSSAIFQQGKERSGRLLAMLMAALLTGF
jgi:hypothetical protein